MRTRRIRTADEFAAAVESKLHETRRSKADVASKLALATKMTTKSAYRRLNNAMLGKVVGLDFLCLVAKEVGLRLDLTEAWS